jgi:Inorganic Pyrophosphatase
MNTLEKMLLGGDRALEFLNIRTDDATPAKRIIDWNGFKIGLQYLPFEFRHGKVLTAAYGHIQKTKGEDEMAVDVYVGTKLESPKIYAIAQHINGSFDEEKIVIGVETTNEAKAIYLAAMPEDFFGGIRELTVNQLREYRTDSIPPIFTPDKSKENIRRDFAAGLLSRSDALRMLGYENEEVAERADAEYKIDWQPTALSSSTESAKFIDFEELDGKEWGDRSIYLIQRSNADDLFAVGYENEEVAEEAYLAIAPLNGYLGIEEITSERSDSLRLDRNYVRDSRGRFARVAGSSQPKEVVAPDRINSKTNIAQLKAIADKHGIEVPKKAHKRASWHEAIKAHPEGGQYFEKKPRAKNLKPEIE